MKELSIKEKAKAYDGNYKAYTELINRLEDEKDAIKKQNYGIAMDILCKPYPQFQVITHSELKEESEDERISKEIIKYLEQTVPHHHRDEVLKSKEWIAWLEKQGEPIDKIVKRAMNEKQRVLLTETNGDANIDWDTRSIQDVKLLLEYGLDYIKKLEKQKVQKPADKVEPKFKVGDTITDPTDSTFTFHINKIEDGRYIESDDAWVLIKEADSDYELVEQNPAWSEEDEKIALSIEQVMNCASLLNIAPEKIDKIRTWLNSLKDRVQPQPKQEWSEEDERAIGIIKVALEHPYDMEGKWDRKFALDWLKEHKNQLTKPKNTWKPSDEQMEALEHFIVYHNGSTNYAKDLEELRVQLKKLK